jgi:hypothetical protein
MKIQTAKVFANEIAKTEDFEYGFESLITNSKIVDSAINRCAHDYACGGALYIGGDNMSVGLRKLWANSVDPNVPLPVYSENDTDPIAVVPPASGTRIDIIEAQGLMAERDTQQRAFVNAATDPPSYQYQNTNTKQFLDLRVQFKAGAIGTGVAPAADSGWIKLGEIEVTAGMSALAADNLRGVSAEFDGDANAAWTAESDRTFYLGSLNELVVSYLTEHCRNGQHKDAVIRQNNIDFGDASAQGKVSGATIPLGKPMTLPQNKPTPAVVLAAESLYNALAEFAPLDSPALTGTPTAPTAAANTASTQLATVDYVNRQRAGMVVFSYMSTSERTAARLLQMTGQTVGNALYPDLCRALGGAASYTLPDCRGLFIRGTGSQTLTPSGYAATTYAGASIGGKQTDAMRNITGEFHLKDIAGNNSSALGVSNTSDAVGAFCFKNPSRHELYAAGSNNHDGYDLAFDASLVVPTAVENRPANVSFDICITY